MTYNIGLYNSGLYNGAFVPSVLVVEDGTAKADAETEDD